ncbi:MAG: hypothetical protein ABIE94_06675 [archaeon]
MTKMKYEVVIVAVLIILALTLSGCGFGGGGSNSPGQIDPKRVKFYTGTEGVDIELQGGTPPNTIYYDSQGDNEFDIDVEVQNKGPSFTRGAIFVSGFDPDMMKFEGMNIREYTYRDCYLDWESFGNDGSIIFGCDDYFDFTGGNDGYWGLGLELGDILQEMGIDLGELDIEIGGQGGDIHDLNINWDNMNIEGSLHGKALTAIAPFGASLGEVGEPFFLKPDNYDNPGGDFEYITYHGEIDNWPEGLDDTYQTFLITSCYLYETYAAPLVCIDPDLYSGSKKVCAPGTQTWGGGQGAPVAVTKIEQETTPQKVFFTIHVANVGGGTVYDKWWLGKCSPYSQGRTTLNEQNVVNLAYVKIGKDFLNCVPETQNIRLDESGRGQITCVYDIRYNTIKSAYNTPLIIALWYGYEEHTQKQVYFKRIG